jgi:hypothetical protein
MMLGEPHRVVTGAIHDGDTFERHVIDGGEGLRAIEPAKELQNADLHGASPSIVTPSHPRQGAIGGMALQLPSGTQSRQGEGCLTLWRS